MLIFVDFETDDLEGKVIEAFAVDNNCCKISELNIKINNNFELFFNKIFENYKKDFCIVFWHHFMPVYLSNNYKNIYKKLEGKFICFTDIYSFYNNVEKSRYKISKITEDLIKKQHKGNAKDDCIDLYECFYKLKNKRRK